MGHGTDYDEQFKQLISSGITDVVTLYETMAIDDIRAACSVLYPVWEKPMGWMDMSVWRFLHISLWTGMQHWKTHADYGKGLLKRIL